MTPRILGPEELTTVLSEALAGVVVDHPVVVLVGEALEGLHDELNGGNGVLCVVDSAESGAEQLEAGATEVLLWPSEAVMLPHRVRRTAQLARLPWLEQLHQLVDDSVEFTTTDVTLLDVNPGFEKVTGYAREDVLGKTTGELFRSASQDAGYYKQIGQALSRKEVWRGQLSARRQDGSVSFQSATIATVLDRHGHEVGHVSIKRDGSRDNLAFSALQGAEARTRVLLDRAAEAVIVHDAVGNIADVNQAACKMLGLTREEMLASKLHQWEVGLPPESLFEIWAVMGSTPVSAESVWQRSNGERFPVEVSAGKVQLAGSEFIMVVSRDISERKEAEIELRRVNAELRQLTTTLEQQVASRTVQVRNTLAQLEAVLESLADGLVATDTHGRIEVFNQTLRGLLGVHPQDLAGSAVGVVHPAFPKLVRTCVDEGLAQTLELSLHGNRVGQAVASPIVAQGQVLGAVILLRDVTLAKEVDRMKTEFIATVSHELRTPLTSVLGFAKLARTRLNDLLLPSLPDDRKVQRAAATVSSNLDIIASEGARLSELINDVLDISKMEAGRVDWKMQEIKPNDVVQRALVVTEALVGASGLEMITELGTELPAIIGDRDRLIQVVINLISNAVKFTETGRIWVSTSMGADGVKIAVRDTGMGIPEAERAVVFEKFRQVSDTLTNKPKGTGLGLPISKHIVEHHGGRMWVESEVGVGSTFAFVVPEARNSPVRKGAEEALSQRLLEHVNGEARLESTPGEILVVDDDPSLRELLRQVLTDAGHRVRLTEDGYAAIREIREKRPDVVVLDVLMPGLSGFDVAAMLRADPETEDLPIIVLSILADKERGVRLGVDRYLSKPLNNKQLLGAIDVLMAKVVIPRRVLVVGNGDGKLLADILEEHGGMVVGRCGFDKCDIEQVRSTEPDMILIAEQDARAEKLIAAVRDDPQLKDVYVMMMVDA